MENDQTLKPKSRVSSTEDSKELAFEDAAVLEIRRILNTENIHRSSSSRTEGYIHSVQKYDINNPVLYLNMQSKKNEKEHLARRAYEILSNKGIKVSYTENKFGVKIFLRPLIVAKKLENVNYNPLKDNDVLLHFVLEKSIDFHHILLSALDPKVLASFIEKKLAK